MSNEITIPAGFGQAPAIFTGGGNSNDELGAGVSASYGIMGYRGKVWAVKHQGTEHPLMRDDGDGPRNSIEVVLLKASPAISKIFYKDGYVDGSNSAPDCWSSNGATPDPSVQNKQSATCADCPMNAWGSRVTEAGKQGKKCSDSRRVAIVPSSDMDNEVFGGPMLLRIPAASLKDLKQYGDVMKSYQFDYFACVTKISFDPNEAYPKFVFTAVRPLTEEEGRKVLELRDGPQVKAVLSEDQGAQAPAQPSAPAPAASPFGQPVGGSVETPQAAPAPAPAPAPQANPFAAAQPAPAAPAAPAQAAPTPEPAPAAPAAAPPEPAPAPAPTPAQSAPSSFDDMLNNII
jgi:hypothetical protein